MLHQTIRGLRLSGFLKCGIFLSYFFNELFCGQQQLSINIFLK